MKKTYLSILFLLLIACESSDNKMSRLTIDKYTRKLSSMIENIVLSREEEGSQSQLALNNFYQRYTTQIESFINDLNFETISPKYVPFRDDLLTVAKTVNYYLNCRKSSINNLSEIFSAFESGQRNIKDYKEYLSDMRTSSYSIDLYSNLAKREIDDWTENAITFERNKIEYNTNMVYLDSVNSLIDSVSKKYNNIRAKAKLNENLIIPSKLNDTINDWIIKGKSNIRNLEFPSFD